MKYEVGTAKGMRNFECGVRNEFGIRQSPVRGEKFVAKGETLRQ